jgi:predicted ArsR family transcriptional regulator
MNLEEVLDVFRTDEDKAKLLAMQIANDRGREVLECIFRGRPKSASEIARELNVPLPTVMFHIERFLEIGTIKVVKTRMSKKLREIKYYGPAKRAILIIPSQKEETMSYIANAVKSSIITPLTAALVIVVSAGVGYIMKRVTTVREAAQPMLEEAAKEAPEMLEAPRMDSGTGALSSLQPVFLVLLGFILTLVILGIYSYVKNKKGSFM